MKVSSYKMIKLNLDNESVQTNDRIPVLLEVHF